MSEPKCTYAEADAALAAYYSPVWADEDPEWWADMIEAVMERGVWWLDNPDAEDACDF